MEPMNAAVNAYDASSVWIFTGEKPRFPGGVFTARDSAEAWIKKRGLSGTLTRYHLNVGVYDWAIENKMFSPKTEAQRDASFIAGFTSAAMDHHHYENGALVS